MSANHSESDALEMAGRDRVLRGLIGCFAAAAFVSLGLAVFMSMRHQTVGYDEPFALAQDEL